jgi:hypothetical protein
MRHPGTFSVVACLFLPSFLSGPRICELSRGPSHKPTCPEPNRLQHGDIRTGDKKFDPVCVNHVSDFYVSG